MKGIGARTIAWLLTIGALAVAATASSSAGDDPSRARIEVVWDDDVMGFQATSSKDISNVIVKLCDGTVHKHDGLNRLQYQHRESAAIAGIWVKSGSNSAGAGAPPGAGQWFASPGCDAGPAPTSTSTATETTTSSPPPSSSTPPPSTTSSSPPQSDDCIRVMWDQDGMGFTATSCKDISNIIVKLCVGTMHKHDGLSGHEFVHREGELIAGIWVKSGDNSGGPDAPPGAGEWFASPGCDARPTTTSASPTPTTSTSSPPPSSSSPAPTTTSSPPPSSSSPAPTTTSSPPPSSTSPSPTQGESCIRVVWDQDGKGFTATSCKELSNIIVKLCVGTMHKHDGLRGHEFVHREDGTIEGIWVKSGDNHAGPGAPPGAGEWFQGLVCRSEPSPSPTATQSPQPTSTPPPSTTPTQGPPPSTTPTQGPAPTSTATSPPGPTSTAPSPGPTEPEPTSTTSPPTDTMEPTPTAGTTQSPTTTAPIPFFPSGTALALGVAGAIGGTMIVLRRRS